MIKKIFALPVIEQISPVLSRRKLDELDLIVVDHPQVKASFALQGAHLLSWKPAGEEEVLWLSNNTPFKNGVAIRGGVPVCWPWFGPAAQQGLPAHGFARNLPWTLKSHREDADGVALTFELTQSEETRKTLSRRPVNASPTTFSAPPSAYISAVSMRVKPSSMPARSAATSVLR